MKWELLVTDQPQTMIELDHDILPDRVTRIKIHSQDYWIEWSPNLQRLLIRDSIDGPYQVLHYRRITSITARGSTRITLETETQVYHLKVQRPLPPGVEGKKKKSIEIVDSPMTGKVLKVCCSDGDTVESGQTLAIVEAMKMENRISAPVSGIIKSIHVAENDNISTGQDIATITTS